MKTHSPKPWRLRHLCDLYDREKKEIRGIHGVEPPWICTAPKLAEKNLHKLFFLVFFFARFFSKSVGFGGNFVGFLMFELVSNNLIGCSDPF